MAQTKIVIPAAGLATRMRPLSNNMSKAMIPVNGKPIIAYILDTCRKIANDSDICVVVGCNPDIAQFCSRKYPNVKIRVQENPIGPGDAVMTGLSAVYDSNVGNGYFDSLLVWLGDTLYDIDDIERFIEENHNYDYVLTAKVKDPSRWCMIDEAGKLYDKPTTTDLPDDLTAIVGVYNFSEIGSLTKVCGAKEMSDLICSKYANGSTRVFDRFIDYGNWYDCGELETYYESKAALLNKQAREGHDLFVDTSDCTVTKRGFNILQEYMWYNSVKNTKMESFIPHIHTVSDLEVKMSLAPGSTLQELLIFDNLKNESWTTIINRTLDSYNLGIGYVRGKNLDRVSDMFYEKNLSRVFKYDYDFVNKTDKGLVLVFINDVYVRLKEFAENNLYSDIIHGDLHFGNIIFDPTIGKITFIDPRGCWAGETTTFGNICYDLAKLYQSVYCEYAWLLNDDVVDTEKKDFIIKLLDLKVEQIFKLNKEQIQTIKNFSVVMLLTCLPFHGDDVQRQMRFWNKGLSLL